MANPLNFLPGAVGQSGPAIIHGIVSERKPSPLSFDDPLYVVMPGWDTDIFWTIEDWPACHGTTLPPAGNDCLLAYDDAGRLYCIWWSGTTTYPVDDDSSLTSRHWLGLNGNSLSGYGDLTYWPQRGVVYDRLEFLQPSLAVGASSGTGATVATAVANGMIPVVLLDPSTYGTGAIPTGGDITIFANYVVSQIQTLEFAFPGKGLLYEVINEPWTSGFYSPTPSAAQHADVIAGVWDAAVTAGLDMTRVYAMAEDAAYVALMYAEQPSLKTLVQGWSVHPYGGPPPGYASSTGQGIASVPEFRDALFSGADNILISEIGLWDYSQSALHEFDESTALDAATAARWTRQIVNAARAYHDAGWLKALIWYNRNSTGWATNSLGGALTSVGTALSQNAQPIKSLTTGTYAPTDDNYLTATMLPEAARDAISLTSGKLYVARIRVDERAFARYIYVHVTNAGVGLTSSQCFAALYDSLGNQYDVSGDQSTAWQTTGRKPMDFSGDNFKPGVYYVVLLSNGGTPPQFAGASAVGPIGDGNGAVAPARANQAASSGSTSMPGSITLSSLQVSSSLIWAALGV